MWLNGKKTIIGSTALWLAWSLGGMPPELAQDWVPVAIYWLNWIGGVMTPAGLLHKGLKYKGIVATPGN